MAGAALESDSVAAHPTLTLYRIVRTDPPTLDDMRSYIDMGIPLRRNDPESLRRASGISLFDTLARARRQARRQPWMGNAFIAEMVIPLDRIDIEQTAVRGHFTAWGAPDAMLEYVRRIERV